MSTIYCVLHEPPALEQLPQVLEPELELKGSSGSTVNPIYVKSMETDFTFSKSSFSIQKVKSLVVNMVSFSFDSSRANAKRGPLQPPGDK